jgi:glycosyltransferase involved in cell wall biosynthesis
MVVPCFNEEAALQVTAPRFVAELARLVAAGCVKAGSRVLFVDDGSTDATWPLILRFAGESERIAGMRLSRNEGKERALVAGFAEAAKHADAAVAIDADLQDDLSVIARMIARYAEGCEIVYGIRSVRKYDSLFKRLCSHAFYYVMRRMGVELMPNHSDFCFLGRRALLALDGYRETNVFFRGFLPRLGFKSGVECYECGKRSAGKSKYSFRKQLELACEGITSFSAWPLHALSALGLCLFLVNIALLVYVALRFVSGHAFMPWMAVLSSIWGMGGLLLIAAGVLGEYIWKIYIETKRRPRYHIEETVHIGETPHE